MEMILIFILLVVIYAQHLKYIKQLKEFDDLTKTSEESTAEILKKFEDKRIRIRKLLHEE